MQRILSITLLALCAGNVLAAPDTQEDQDSSTSTSKDCYVDQSGKHFCGQPLSDLKCQYRSQCADKVWTQQYPPSPEHQACIDLDKNIREKEALEHDRSQYQDQCADRVWPDIFPPVPAEQACIDLAKKIDEREGLERMKNQYQEQCADAVFIDIHPPSEEEQACIDLKKSIGKKEEELDQGK
ncbi:hypothetical protein TI39_contig328g00022 [Zymoseptoria brevis]|uniref:Secreted protein n=1 Tax=Zymoseptoria brevis TaxID=1047168 RepID=A0A0F4GTW8_9PEZI|nr:hypothetical protein TI39_contig328g00022 [Zymoseptoria brevis]